MDRIKPNNILSVIIVILLLASCEKAFMEKDPANNAGENFDHLWNTLDRKYSFFELKEVDWQRVYDENRGRVYPGMSEDSLFSVMAGMLAELRDGHVNLRSEFNRSRYWNWYLDYPANFDYNLVERHYLANSYEISGPLQNRVIDSVGYIYYPSFSQNISADNIDHVISKFSDMKGVIIDVRSNGGGSTSNGDLLASRFADQPRYTFSVRYKDGPAHDEFTPPVAESISPSGPRQFTGPVVVLANRKSYSATNDFIQQMRVFPHVTIMGDTTGGGGGLPFDGELPNGWTFRFSTTVTTAPDGLNIEQGIPPDIYVELDTTDILEGEDTIIEAALEFLE